MGDNSGDIENNHGSVTETEMRGLYGAPQHDCGAPIGRTGSSGAEGDIVPEITGTGHHGLRGVEANTNESKGVPNTIPEISGPQINTPPAAAFRGSEIAESY